MEHKTLDYALVRGSEVRPGDTLHDHDDAVVLEVKTEAQVVTALVRRATGHIDPAFFGVNAVMTVSRPNTVTVECAPCRWCGGVAHVVVPEDGYKRWMAGELVQKSFPDLKPEQREQLISGIHPSCWDALFGD